MTEIAVLISGNLNSVITKDALKCIRYVHGITNKYLEYQYVVKTKGLNV